MSNFEAKDPRGEIVVVTDAAWKHSEPHHVALGGKLRLAWSTVTRPDLIIDNPPLAGRIADQRYVAFSAELGTHVVIPTVRIGPGDSFGGYTAGVAPANVSATIYTSSGIPSHTTVLWKK